MYPVRRRSGSPPHRSHRSRQGRSILFLELQEESDSRAGIDEIDTIFQTSKRRRLSVGATAFIFSVIGV